MVFTLVPCFSRADAGPPDPQHEEMIRDSSCSLLCTTRLWRTGPTNSQPSPFIHLPAAVKKNNKKTARSCLLSDGVKVKVYLRADMWEHIDLISSACGEYHKMMRTSQEVSRGSILNPISFIILLSREAPRGLAAQRRQHLTIYFNAHMNKCNDTQVL